MNNKYSYSLNPRRMLIVVAAFVLLAKIAGYIISRQYPSVLADYGGHLFNGIILLIIFVYLLAVPLIRNRRKSIFQKSRIVRSQFEGIGTMEGMPNVVIKVLEYDDGIEIRAFYSTYFIPFKAIQYVRIDKDNGNEKKLIIKTGIRDLPEYIESDYKEFWDYITPITEKIKKEI